jgi:acyl transferase domain-containing protein
VADTPARSAATLTPAQASARRRVREAAARLALRVSFGHGRRATDVTLVVVKGARSEVLRKFPALVEGLGLDVEVVRSAQTPDGYEVVMVLMVPREQRVRHPRERRASEIGDGER